MIFAISQRKRANNEKEKDIDDNIFIEWGKTFKKHLCEEIY